MHAYEVIIGIMGIIVIIDIMSITATISILGIIVTTNIIFQKDIMVDAK
jgi:hypothetical protein